MFENLLNLQPPSKVSLFILDELYVKRVRNQEGYTWFKLCKLETNSSSSSYTSLIRRYTCKTCNISLSTNVIAGTAMHARVSIVGMINLRQNIDV